MLMPDYDTLDDYLTDYAEDPDLAVMPISIVADHLGKTPAAVAAMIRTGKLEEVRIGKSRFVQLSSLLSHEDGLEEQYQTVKRHLMKLAKKGTRKIYYEPIMDELGMSTSVPADRTKIGAILGRLSEETYEQDGVLLSVLVHRKTAGVTNPGPGFFNLAKGMKFKWKDKNDFVEEQTDAVLAAYSKD